MGSFWNFCYLSESRDSPISEFGISRNGFEEAIGGLSFGLLENGLLASIGINRKLSETLKQFYTTVYRKGKGRWDFEYLRFKNPYGKSRRGRLLSRKVSIGDS